MAPMDEPVGYKSPPVRTRFQPGQSGNPGGRPKAKAGFYDDVAEIFSRPLIGQIAGKPVTITMTKAMFRSLCRKAINGDRAAMKNVVGLILTLTPLPGAPDDDERREFELKKKMSRMLKIDIDDIDLSPPKLTREQRVRQRVQAKEREKKIAAYREKLARDDAAAKAAKVRS